MVRVAFIALGAWLCTASGLSAQTSADGSIRGVVKDEQQAALAGVAITATSPDVPHTYTAVTDAAGEYRLLNVAPGSYTLVAERQGFARLAREGVLARAGLNLQVDLVMQVGNVTETVEVHVETPLLESRGAQQAVNVDGDLQRSLPLTSRRAWYDSLQLVPGITTSGATSAQFFLRGSNLDAHVVRLDGAPVEAGSSASVSTISLSTDALDDTQIRIGGVDASSPLGVGATISVAAPTGTNQIAGSTTIAYQARAWNGNNAPGGSVSAGSQLESDLSVGGPIVRDRAWFFGAYRYHDAETGISRTEAQIATVRALVPGYEPFDALNRAHYVFAKGTVQRGPRHQVQGFYQYDESPIKTGDTTADGPYLRTVQGGSAIGVRMTSVWSSVLTTRVVGGYTRKGIDDRVAFLDRPGRAIHQTAFLSSGRLTGSGQIATLDNRQFGEEDTTYPKTTLSADVSYYHSGLGGSHEVQSGFYLERIDGRTALHYFNDGFILQEEVLVDPANPGAGTRAFHRQIYDVTSADTFNGKSANTAFYVQDSWRPLARLTINAGVRFDGVRQRDDLFGIETERSLDIGPRFGANYLLTADGRNSLQASWTRVFDALNRTRTSAGTASAGVRNLYDNNLDGVFETVLITPPSTVLSQNRAYDPELHQPYVDEWTLGYRRQLPGGTSAGAVLAHRDYRHRPVSVEINGIYENGVFRGYRNEAQNDILLVTNNRYNTPVVTDLELQLAKQSARLQILAAYTRQWRHLDGTWQPNDAASFLQPETFANDKGIGATHASDNSISGVSRPNWRDHVGRLGIVYHAPWQIQLAGSYMVQSGQWSSQIVTRLAAADPRFGPATVTLSNGRVVANPLATTLRIAFPTRSEGQFAAPTVQTVNLRVGRDITFGRRRLTAAVDVFNATNRGDFTILAGGANQTFSPLYQQGASLQAPRVAQVSLQFRF